ncbi:MAG: rhodanese-like domain-containing protein [Bdellovibrionales bacterium]|nr:rhodanese-like domain-containing protein [Bdellovibrionales bacterium]
MKMEKIKDIYDKLPAGEVILDVRTPEEYAEGHVPGSINIPHEEVTQHLDELKKYSVVHIHCRSGGRAGKAMAVLTNAGLTNLHCIDDSGMMHWMEKGYPVETK